MHFNSLKTYLLVCNLQKIKYIIRKSIFDLMKNQNTI